MRFEAEIPYPVDTVVTSFCDNAIRKKWDTQISDKNKVFDERIEGNIQYDKVYHYTKFPFMISDREIVAERKIVRSYTGDSKKTLVTLHSIEEPSYPIKSNPVRTTMYVNAFYFEANGDKSTKVISVRKWDMHFAGPMLKMMKKKGGPGADAVKTMIDGIKKGCEMVLESKK